MDIRSVIKSKGYNIGQIAEEIGISRSALQQSIDGNPTVNRLEEIAQVLQCSVTDFFEPPLIEPEKEEMDDEFICGFLFFNQDRYEIHSRDDIADIYKRVCDDQLALLLTNSIKRHLGTLSEPEILEEELSLMKKFYKNNWTAYWNEYLQPIISTQWLDTLTKRCVGEEKESFPFTQDQLIEFWNKVPSLQGLAEELKNVKC